MGLAWPAGHRVTSKNKHWLHPMLHNQTFTPMLPLQLKIYHCAESEGGDACSTVQIKSQDHLEGLMISNAPRGLGIGVVRELRQGCALES